MTESIWLCVTVLDRTSYFVLDPTSYLVSALIVINTNKYIFFFRFHWIWITYLKKKAFIYKSLIVQYITWNILSSFNMYVCVCFKFLISCVSWLWHFIYSLSLQSDLKSHRFFLSPDLLHCSALFCLPLWTAHQERAWLDHNFISTPTQCTSSLLLCYLFIKKKRIYGKGQSSVLLIVVKRDIQNCK